MEMLKNDQIQLTGELPDGSSVYQVGANLLEEEKASEDFDENLALSLDDDVLASISSYLVELIKEDERARAPWLEAIKKAEKYLSYNIEDTSEAPFPHACRTFDTTMTTALMRYYANVRSELLPADGPAGYRIEGDLTPDLEIRAEKVTDWLNYYLTVEDQGYYSDFEKFLMRVGFEGSGVKKIYFDPIKQRPISRFISKENFIIDADCASILDSNRLTHILELSKREIILNMQAGVYRQLDLAYLKNNNSEEEDKKSSSEGIDLGAYTKRSLFPIYETHTYLNLQAFIDKSQDQNSLDLPLPYIVTIDKNSGEVLSIKKNWRSSDERFQRINYFVQYQFLPGPGAYGLGLAQLMGSSAIAATTMQRQSIDAGTFKNLPGGLRKKSFKQQQTDIIVGPGQWIEVDTGAEKLAEAFFPLPNAEPSGTLIELRREIIEQMRELGSTSELGMLSSREDIPVGTTLANLETHNKIQSSVLKSLHFALSQELQMLNELFEQTITEENFALTNKSSSVSYEDYGPEIKVIPVSDPSMGSKIEKMIRAESVLKTALSDPSMHDMRAVYQDLYQAQGIPAEQIEKLLPAPSKAVPLDPISENMNFLLSEPVVASLDQFHAGHIIAHGTFAEENPQLKPVILAHIAQHQAYQYLIDMQKRLNITLPDQEELKNNLELQNEIALALANLLGEQEDSKAAAPIDPNTIMMLEIEQKREESMTRERIAQQKVESEAFSIQMEFEKEMKKIESNEKIAQLKADTEMQKQELQSQNG